MKEQAIKWRDVEIDVLAYLKANGVNLTVEEFRNPRGGTSGRKYIGASIDKLRKLDPPWVRLSDEPCDYDDSLWRGVRAYESFCIMFRKDLHGGRSCAEFCDELFTR